MAIESRKAWGARSPKSVSRISSTRGVKAHYTGGKVDKATLTDHEKCRAAIRGYQNGHMDGNGWADLAYSMWVCNHTAGMGRGPGVLTAANGPGLNSGHYSILFLVGNAGVTKPTDAMKRHFHEARDYLRKHGGAGADIKGHRDGYSTDCPGDPIYAWVRAGAPKPGGSKSPAQPAPKTEDAMKYGSFSYKGAPVPIPANEWWPVPFDTEHADPFGDHSGRQETILIGDPCAYTLEFAATISGLPAGTKVLVQTAEYVYRKADGTTPAHDELVEHGDPTPHMIEMDGLVHHAAVGWVQEGRKLRAVIKVPIPATLTRAKARYLAQQ